MSKLLYTKGTISPRHHVIYALVSILSIITFSIYSTPQTTQSVACSNSQHTFSLIPHAYAATACGCNQNPDIIYSDVTPGTPYGNAITTMTESCVFTGFSAIGCASIPTAFPCFGGGRGMARIEAIMAITRYHINIRGDWTLQTTLPQHFADYDASFGQSYYELQTAWFYGLVFGDTCANMYGAGNTYGAGQCIDPNSPWLYGFHGVLRNDPQSLNGSYNFLASSGSISRGAFAQGMYDYYKVVDDPAIQLACVPTPGPLPPPSTGNIINLNFGVTSSNPWVQFVGFDARFEDGFTTNVPDVPAYGPPVALRYNAITNGGIFFTGASAGTFQFGVPGSAARANTNQYVVYPEEYTTTKAKLYTSYDNILALAQASGQSVTSIPASTSLSLNTYDTNGVFQAAQDLHIIASAYSPPGPNTHVIVVVAPRDIYIDGPIQIVGNNSVIIISAGRNIIVDPIVGESAFGDTASAAAPYSIAAQLTAGKDFIINGTGSCATEKQLVVQGGIVVNASLISGSSAGKFINNRDLCTNNNNPSAVVRKRLDFIINAPEFLKIPSFNFREDAP